MGHGSTVMRQGRSGSDKRLGKWSFTVAWRTCKDSRAAIDGESVSVGFKKENG